MYSPVDLDKQPYDYQMNLISRFSVEICFESEFVSYFYLYFLVLTITDIKYQDGCMKM